MLPISVCIIAKNEEARIERCLSSLVPYGFEIILVDTGSTDLTKELAAKYTNHIYDFVWVDDFSAARNFSLERASNEWILMMDCDEWIEEIDLEELAYFRKQLSHAAGSVTRRNLTDASDALISTIDYTERFFSKRRFHYTGIIHEQLTPKYEKSFETFLLNTTIGHSGYLMTPEQRRAKSERNISLLQKQLLEKPEDSYTLYQLGKGYEMIPDADKACHYFERALLSNPRLDFSLAYTQALLISYGEALLDTKQFHKALTLANYKEALSDNADYFYLLGLIYSRNQLYENALDSFETALSCTTVRRLGTNSFLSYYEIGVILTMISEWEMAKNYFKQCGEYAPAQHALRVLKEQNL